MLDAGYELVAKAGNIEYKRPLRTETFIARSTLPSRGDLEIFRATLEREGKAFLDVKGRVVCVPDDEKTYCLYSIEVCAFRPRSSKM